MNCLARLVLLPGVSAEAPSARTSLNAARKRAVFGAGGGAMRNWSPRRRTNGVTLPQRAPRATPRARPTGSGVQFGAAVLPALILPKKPTVEPPATTPPAVPGAAPAPNEGSPASAPSVAGAPGSATLMRLLIIAFAAAKPMTRPAATEAALALIVLTSADNS